MSVDIEAIRDALQRELGKSFIFPIYREEAEFGIAIYQGTMRRGNLPFVEPSIDLAAVGRALTAATTAQGG